MILLFLHPYGLSIRISFKRSLTHSPLGRYPSSGCFLHEYLGSCRLSAAVIGPCRTTCEVGNYADGVRRSFVLEEMCNLCCKTWKVSCRLLKNYSLISELSCGASETSGSKDQEGSRGLTDTGVHFAFSPFRLC